MPNRGDLDDVNGSSSGSILFANVGNHHKAMPAMKINMVCTLTLCMLVITLSGDFH